MQIRLTVVDPLGPPPESRVRAASCDVLVTAPAGTALAAVASGLASAVGAGDAPVVLFAGAERLDAQRCTLGEPPLLDGAVLTLGAPAEPGPEPDEDAAQLHVVAGPDAGGVHLLHGGVIHVGRSADADVPLDDPDVSRLHCAVTVAADGRVSVADLGSTNGTMLDGTRVTDRPVRFAPGALLRLGESALRLAPPGGVRSVGTAPDGEGHVRVLGEGGEGSEGAEGSARPATRLTVPHARVGGAGAPETGTGGRTGAGHTGHRSAADRASGDTHHGFSVPGGTHHGVNGPGGTHHGVNGPGDTHHGFGVSAWGASGGLAPGAQEHGPVESPIPAPVVPGQGGAPRWESRDAASEDAVYEGTRKGTPLRGTDVPPGVRRRGGFTAWARRLAGGRGEPGGTGREDAYGEDGGTSAPAPSVPRAPEKWPDPAALLLTALGPGPRLWERGPGHPESLTVRLGTADRAAPDGSGLLPAVPVTAGLREVGTLGLAGPRARLAGLARAVVAQLAALHSPDALELVLISADRSRTLEERTAEWSWLGWLPHLRPAHGQDCRLLLAYDREQATARTDELLRRLEDHLAGPGGLMGTGGATGTGRLIGTGRVRDAGSHADTGRATDPDRHTDMNRPAGAADTVDGAWRGGPHPGADPSGRSSDGHHAAADQDRSSADRQGRPSTRGAARRPSWALDDDPADGAFAGPYTVVVVDGDPGGADVREAVVRLAREGARAGIHVVCLAETPSASPASPVTETFEAACAASPVFRECGAVALLSGDVATALRLLRVAPGGSAQAHGHRGPVGHGTLAAVDAVSPAWAERFARALAPLRTDGSGDRHARVSAPLPQAARLLDELGLARATPASLLARWADAADDTESLGGRAWAVLGAGPRGPVGLDLAAEGPHLLIEGPSGSGRTELLRSIAASLAAAERPDRLGIVLVDGRDCGANGGTGGDGLRVCTDLPHVTTHLAANDPVRMREFAQSLSAELKRRAELLGRLGFTEWHTQRAVADRIMPQRAAGSTASGDLDTPPSTTLRLRPAATRQPTEAAPPPARLVVLVDDLDGLLSPALGSPGRPAAGSVVRALEAVARDGARLGVHLVAAADPDGRTAEWAPARTASLRITLDAVSSGVDEPSPGRGQLTRDGKVTPFQGGRITGRIPRTATLRPTVVPLEWHRMGDPPARRPVRELGNGPTDLALLASALERAARSVSAVEVPSLL
ncbi:FHA domain-containing protein [Streptomyces yaanensis]|uniref:FHA domain-containing protein n=1 Tax=Streptomyces yaanensis TaxID=1142239 RepID=A0ABV7SNI9_9ACTN|nr:FHA domain-containing protein [Streptomyces sp. CGMCC 4.7035]WNC03286.1 FHA domain-containing protein [Streptomyces sp. CGMCC 4.7035]